MAMEDEEGDEYALVPAAYVKMKARDSVLLAFQDYPVENVVQLLVANASPEHTLLATKELAYRAADPANCEDIYEAGGISALADLVLEEDLQIKIEALNGLINLAVDDQSRMDLHEAGVVMLAVAQLQHPSPLVIFKACNLIINITCLDEAKETVREENGIPALVAALRTTNERVRLMAVKALHNVLYGCIPYANHEALLATPSALLLLMKLVLTSQDVRVVSRLLKLLHLLLQFDGAAKAFCFGQKGPKMLLVLLKRNSEDTLMVASILRLVKIISSQDGLESLNLVERVLSMWKEHRNSHQEVAVAGIRTLLTLTDRETNRQQFLSVGLDALAQALGSSLPEEQAASAAIVARIVQDEESASQLLDANVLGALMQMLSMKNVKAVHHALSASAHLLGMASKHGGGLQPLHDSVGNLIKLSLSRHKQIQLKALLLLEVVSQSHTGCARLAEENAISVLFQLLPEWSERAQVCLLRIACASMENAGCAQQVMKSGKLKYVSTFLAGKQSEEPLKVELATLTHSLLTKLKARRAEQRASLGLNSPFAYCPAPLAAIEEPKFDKSRLLDESRDAAAASLSPRVFLPTEPAVEVPTTDGQQTLVDKFAALVAAKGKTVEDQALQKHSQNPRFAFLVNGWGTEWIYYLSKVSAAQLERGGEEDSRFLLWKRERLVEERRLFDEEEDMRVNTEVERRKTWNKKVREEHENALKAHREKASNEKNQRDAEASTRRQQEIEAKEKATKEHEMRRIEAELERQEKELQEQEKEMLRRERELEEGRKRDEEETERKRLLMEEEKRRIAAEERAMAEEMKRLEEERRVTEERERKRIEEERAEELEKERERKRIEEERQLAEKEQLESLSELDAAMMELESLMDEDSVTLSEALEAVAPKTVESDVVSQTSSVAVSSSSDLSASLLAFEAAAESLSVPLPGDVATFESLSGLTPPNATEEELRALKDSQLAPSATELPCVNASDVGDISSAASPTAVEEFSSVDKETAAGEDTEASGNSLADDRVALASVVEEAEEVCDVSTLKSCSSISSIGVSSEAIVDVGLKPLASSDADDMLESAVVLIPPLTVAVGVAPPMDVAPGLPVMTGPVPSLPPRDEETTVSTDVFEPMVTETVSENEAAPEKLTGGVQGPPAALTPVKEATPVSFNEETPSLAVKMPSTPGLHQLTSSGQRVIVRCSWDDDVRTVRATNDMSMAELAAVVAAKYRKEAADLLACTIKYREMEDFVLLESDDDLEMAFELCESKLELRVATPATLSPSSTSAVTPATPSAPPPPAPAPPPPPSDVGLKKRPAMAPGAAAAAAAAATGMGGVLASDKSSRPGRKPKGPKKMSLFEEMESKRSKLKKADRALSSMTIRRRKIAPKQTDSTDMLSVMMQALDARRQHIATPDLDDIPDDDDWD